MSDRDLQRNGTWSDEVKRRLALREEEKKKKKGLTFYFGGEEDDVSPWPYEIAQQKRKEANTPSFDGNSPYGFSEDYLKNLSWWGANGAKSLGEVKSQYRALAPEGRAIMENGINPALLGNMNVSHYQGVDKNIDDVVILLTKEEFKKLFGL
jgi:hypothetical protein